MTVRALSLVGLAIAALSACNGNSGGVVDETGGMPVATIGSETITQGELDSWIKDELWRSQTDDGNASKVFALRQRGLDRMIDQQLIDAEAAKRGLDADALLDAEAAKRVAVSDAEVKAFFDQHAAQLEGRTLATESKGIREYLEREQGTKVAQDFVAELRAAAKVELLLEAPRVTVAGVGHARGPEGAPVTVIEFSDYECPYCRRAEPVVEQMLKEYAAKVRFEYRHFPLESIHPQARPAAEAAVCADEQGQFWPYHGQIFAGDARALAQPQLLASAAKVGLDVKAFEACLASGRASARVDADLAAGKAAGVTGTPAFYVNGVPFSGALTIEEFRRAIDAELSGAAES